MAEKKEPMAKLEGINLTELQLGVDLTMIKQILESLVDNQNSLIERNTELEETVAAQKETMDAHESRLEELKEDEAKAELMQKTQERLDALESHDPEGMAAKFTAWEETMPGGLEKIEAMSWRKIS